MHAHRPDERIACRGTSSQRSHWNHNDPNSSRHSHDPNNRDPGNRTALLDRCRADDGNPMEQWWVQCSTVAAPRAELKPRAVAELPVKADAG